MRVLLLETTPGAGRDVCVRLERAGHTILRCPGGSDCSIVGLGRCPLVDDAVDVVLDVRSHPEPFTVREQPLVCGILAGVPTVVCGPLPAREPGSDPRPTGPRGTAGQRRDAEAEPRGTAHLDAEDDDVDGLEAEPRDIWDRADVRCGPDDVLDALVAATLPTSPTVRHRIESAVTTVLRRRGVAAPFRVSMRTRRGAVDVHLMFAGRVPPPTVREQLLFVVRACLIPATQAWPSAAVLIYDASPPATPEPKAAVS